MNKQGKAHWISKQPELLPDFIIGGAMKSGTTTLHAILNKHPDIVMAHDELGFFDMDNLLQHADFNFFDTSKKQWMTQSMESKSKELWDWYYLHFEGLRKNNRLVGEDSTTYLASRIAAKRIAQQGKPIKMLFILRHPTARTISNYLHLLKSGRAIYTLEDTLKYHPQSIVTRSLYMEQLEAYYRVLPSHLIKVILFEDLIHNRIACIKEVCEFLEVDFNGFKATDLEVHSNKTVVPKYISLQLLRNKWMQRSRDYRYLGFLPIKQAFRKTLPWRYRLIDKIHKRINPQRDIYKFEPIPSTIKLLDDFFKSDLMGIDTLTEKDIYSKWFPN